MDYNRFGITVFLQSAFLAFTGGIVIFVFGRDYLILTKMTFLTLWFIQFAGLVYYVNNTNRSLTRFLLSLQYNDHIVQPAENKTFKRLNLTYNQIIDRIKKNQIEKETKQQFYQYILEEAETGLVAFTNS